jgi:hypothetical protein
VVEPRKIWPSGLPDRKARSASWRPDPPSRNAGSPVIRSAGRARTTLASQWWETQ